MHAGLEGLPEVKEVHHLKGTDRFIVRYQGEAQPDLIGTAEGRVLFPRLRRWLERIRPR